MHAHQGERCLTRAHKIPVAAAGASKEVHEVETAAEPGVLHRPHGGMWHGGKRCKLGFQCLVQMDECALVAHLVAVVRCRENRDGLAAVVDLVPLVLALMIANQELQPVLPQKPLGHVLPKCHAHPTLRRQQPRICSPSSAMLREKGLCSTLRGFNKRASAAESCSAARRVPSDVLCKCSHQRARQACGGGCAYIGWG